MSFAQEVEIEITRERANELEEKSKTTSLPVVGLHILEVTEESVDQGLIEKDTMISGQDMLIALAEKLEYQGDDEVIRSDIVDAIKLMSNYVTTRLVPIKIPDPLG